MNKTFRKMLAGTIGERYNSDLYSPRYQVLDIKVEEISRFIVLLVLYNSLYDHFDMDNKQAYKWTLWRRTTKAIEAVNLMDKSQNMAPSYRKKDDDEKFRQSDGRMESNESIRP